MEHHDVQDSVLEPECPRNWEKHKVTQRSPFVIQVVKERKVPRQDSAKWSQIWWLRTFTIHSSLSRVILHDRCTQSPQLPWPWNVRLTYDNASLFGKGGRYQFILAVINYTNQVDEKVPYRISSIHSPIQRKAMVLPLSKTNNLIRLLKSYFNLITRDKGIIVFFLMRKKLTFEHSGYRTSSTENKM